MLPIPFKFNELRFINICGSEILGYLSKFMPINRNLVASVFVRYLWNYSYDGQTRIRYNTKFRAITVTLRPRL